MAQVAATQPTSKSVATQPTSKPAWSDFDKTVAELQDWLTLLERMLKSQIVTVGDLQEIEITIQKQKVGLSLQSNLC